MSEDPVAARYPSTARIWNYQLGGEDNLPVDRQASDAANAMVSGLGVPAGADTAIESRHLPQRMVEPGLVAPAQWRPDLDNPLRRSGDHDGDDIPVLKPIALAAAGSDRGIGWHLCGIGVKHRR